MKDEIDYKIVKLLKQDSRRSFVEIAERLGVTEGTVRHRVKRMEKEGSLMFTVKHHGVEGLVMIKAKNIKAVVNQLEGLSDHIYELSGEYDIAAIVDASSIERLNKKIDKIRKISGVISTNTAICLTRR